MRIEFTPANQEIPISFHEVLHSVYSEEELKLPLNNSVSKDNLAGTIVVLKNEIPVARCSVYINPQLLHETKSTICIGHVECVNDQSVFNAIINYVVDYAKQRNISFIIGPMSGSTWQNHRFTLNSADSLFFTETYHKAYYPSLMANTGFEEISRYYSSLDEDMIIDSEKVLRVEERFLKNGYRIREIDLENFRQELENLYEFLMDGFSGNFLFTSITRQQLLDLYLPLQPYLKKELILIAENPKGQPVGLSLNLPDYFDSDKKTFIIKTLAIANDRSLAGMGTVIGNAGYRSAIKAGYTRCIHAFMRESGHSVKTSIRYSGKKFREYALYAKRV